MSRVPLRRPLAPTLFTGLLAPLRALTFHALIMGSLAAAPRAPPRVILGLLANLAARGECAPREDTQVMLRALTSDENAYEWIPVEPLGPDVVLLVLVATLAHPLITSAHAGATPLASAQAPSSVGLHQSQRLEAFTSHLSLRGRRPTQI